MTTHQAIQIVVRAAEANANGHQHCMEILRACEMVREMNKAVAMKGSGYTVYNISCTTHLINPLPTSNLPPGVTDRDIEGERDDDYQRQCEEDMGTEKLERQRAED